MFHISEKSKTTIMNTITTDKQKLFEQTVCKKLGFSNAYLMQRTKSSEQMIIDDLFSHVSHLDVLSGTIAYKNFSKDVLLIATKDSEVNHIDEITLKMVKIMIDDYCQKDEKGKPINKVVFATNIPVAIHSHTARELKKNHNFHIKGIGYSFCQKYNLEHTPMY